MPAAVANLCMAFLFHKRATLVRKCNRNHSVYKVPCATVTRPTAAKLEGSLESDYWNTGMKWNPKQNVHSLEAFLHQV